MMSSPRPTSLAQRLLLGFVIVAVVPLVVTVGLSYWSSRQVVAGLLEENIGKTARLYASEVDDFLAEKTALLEALASGMVAEDAVLKEVVHRSLMVEELIILNRAGELVAHSQEEMGWAVEACRAKDRGLAAMTHAHHGEGHEVVVWVPWERDGRLCGRVSFTLHQDMISERARSTFGGLAYIINQQGDVVCHAFSEEEPHIHPGQPMGGAAAKRARLGVPWHGVIDRDGEAHLAAYAPAVRLPWGVWAEVPLSEASGALTELTTRALGFGALLIFGLSGVILVVVRRIAAPIEELSMASQRIAAGAIGETVPEHGSDEIAALAREFNKMSAALAESVRDLDAKVVERTVALKEAHIHLVHQEKMAALGTLAAGLAHEIGNPLASLSSELELLALQPSEVEEALPVLLDQIRRMKQLLRELVDLGRTHPDPRARFEAVDVVKDVLRLLRHNARERQISLEFEEPDGVLTLCSSRDRLMQVLLNLGLNAVDASSDGTVRFSVTRCGHRVQFVVEDDGTGLPPDRSKLFEPFFTTKSVGHGTGLGLFVVDRIVTSLGGQVRAEDAEGGGARFVVELDCDE